MTPDPSPSPTRLMIPTPGPTTWDVIAQWLAIGLLTTGTVILVVFVAEKLVSSDKKREIKPFYLWIAAIAFFGGLLSFFLPIAINSGFNKEDDGARLRQALLYTTGGLLGVITLGETHRKNDQEKEKNENDHTRQVHAERRSRYTTAVEQLSNENAVVRLGGIYTLVGLIDEWLTDKSIKEENDRRQEGQVIINNLCSYIRSPFPLAEKIEEYEARRELEELLKKEPKSLSSSDSLQLNLLNERFTDYNDDKKIEQITADYAKIHEEQDVRRTIFVEMNKRSSTFKDKKGKVVKTASGPWSEFDFDFSQAPIFYPLNNLTIEKGNFSSAKFYSVANFSEANFSEANFSEAIFEDTARFDGATFAGTAHFDRATFAGIVRFDGATFAGIAQFSITTFESIAHFEGATFESVTNFITSIFRSITLFTDATFRNIANFSMATFKNSTYFDEATFERATYFDGATFIHVDFSEATFEKYSPLFVTTHDESGKTYRAQFDPLSESQEVHNLTVSKRSQPIPRGEAELDGVKCCIPVGTVLFNPSSGETSEPAKPLDESDGLEEDQAE